MSNYGRACGLMMGITLGFAVWGSMGIPAAGKNPAEGATVPETVGTNPAETVITPAAAWVNPAETVTAAGTETGAGELSLHALSAVLMDGDSGRILYGKEADVFRPMASTTKIMTCILALENGNPEDVCTVSGQAASQPKVHLGAPAGRKFYLKDLLYSLMLESHNDSAVIIAEHLAGSVEDFAAMMNQKARDIGCHDTWFITPNGLDAETAGADGVLRTHGTTAADLARIMRYCLRESPKSDMFLTITGTSNYSFTDAEGRQTYSCVNHNALLSMTGEALSGKTGFTGKAGYSYVGAIESEGRTFILALLGSGWPPHKSYKWEDARKLFAYGKDHFHYRDVYEKPRLDPIRITGAVPEKNGEEPFIEPLIILSEEEEHLPLLLGEEEETGVTVILPEYLKAPVQAGEPVGYVQYLLNGEQVRTDLLYASRSVEEWNFVYSMRYAFGKFWLFLSFIEKS